MLEFHEEACSISCLSIKTANDVPLRNCEPQSSFIVRRNHLMFSKWNNLYGTTKSAISAEEDSSQNYEELKIASEFPSRAAQIERDFV